MLNQKSLLVVVASFAVIHILVTFSAHAIFQDAPDESQSTLWEYKKYGTQSRESIELVYSSDGLEAMGSKVGEHLIRLNIRLEEFGQDGWEVYWIDESRGQQTFYLKRPL